jgi:TetR/AcrR family transcriptional regulator, transcriptional repressor for nem operon
MSDISNAIMDAAEAHIRKGGFHGFSFRDIAAEVGIKSSSVHYHFPTKEKLAAAIARRWTDDVIDYIDEKFLTERDPVELWTAAFRSTVHSGGRMCPCSVLGATSYDLPQEVAAAVKEFFKMCHDKMVEQGMTSESADLLLATITGAQIVANAIQDANNFDRVVTEMIGASVKAPEAPAAVAAPKPVFGRRKRQLAAMSLRRKG